MHGRLMETKLTNVFLLNTDLLTKDYNYDYKFVLSVPGSTPMGLVATGLTKGQIFLGDVSAQYKSGKSVVDVKVDTYSNVSTKVTVHEVMPSTKAILSFDVPDHKSGKINKEHHTQSQNT
ncbi:hypothetical protein R6Q59_000163 [Mikania micrantha]